MSEEQEYQEVDRVGQIGRVDQIEGEIDEEIGVYRNPVRVIRRRKKANRDKSTLAYKVEAILRLITSTHEQISRLENARNKAELAISSKKDMLNLYDIELNGIIEQISELEGSVTNDRAVILDDDDEVEEDITL